MKTYIAPPRTIDNEKTLIDLYNRLLKQGDSIQNALHEYSAPDDYDPVRPLARKDWDEFLAWHEERMAEQFSMFGVTF